jgi:hypothetical protein
MKVVDLAINAALGMKESPEDSKHLLELPESSFSKNHVGTAHASTQFALAEACSGQRLFNKLNGIQDRLLALASSCVCKIP